MGGGLIWLAGFLIGGFTVFVVMHAAVWYPRYVELKDRYETERRRRIEAEDSAAHTQFDPDWGPPPIPMPGNSQPLLIEKLDKVRAEGIEELVWADVTPTRREVFDGLDEEGRPKVTQTFVDMEGHGTLIDLTDVGDVPE